jgi:Cu(I)/Ag(I) efflux system membrane fusion protein
MDTEPRDERLEAGDEPTPRGTHAMAIVRWGILLATIALAAFAWWSWMPGREPPASEPTQRRYHCPMHPQIVSDRPGECPICHMALEPMAMGRGGEPTPAPTGPQDASTPPGTKPVELSLDRAQAIGVRTAPVTALDSPGIVRATAVVAPTEQGRAEVHVRAPGFVESLAVDQTGTMVKRGQVMLTLYSPEIYQAESELLAAKPWAASGGEGGQRTLEAAKRKLELLGMSSGDVARLLEKGELIRAIPVYAPRAGYVEKKGVVQGSYVTPEMVLYEVQDFSRVYVVSDVFARDIALVSPGTLGKFTPAGHPERAFPSKVDVIYPTLDIEARTTRVRMQLENPGYALRPGEYGDVELQTGPRKVLAVPRDAVVDTGTETYVFVVVEGPEKETTHFVPRPVVLGEEHGEQVAVRSGVREGERVVSGATFLVDSESRIRASVGAAVGGHP